MRRSPVRRLVFGACLIVVSLTAEPARALSSDVVISQVYGGGGNAGATLRSDFIELFNRGPLAIDLTGWSIQYASSAGTTWQRTNLAGVLAPGRYYLIQQATGAGGTVDLPTPDAVGTIAMSATAGKVALTNSQVLLTGSCPAALVDLVGYGAASCFEGTAAAAGLSNTTASLRGAGGCTETDDNASDFATGPPNPRNMSSSSIVCGVVGPSGVGSADPASVLAGGSVLLTVAVTGGTNPPSTGVTASVDLTPIGGPGLVPMTDDGLGGDVTAGDGVFSVATTVVAGTLAGPKSLAVALADAEGRAGAATIALTVEAPFVAIHEIQGAGSTSPFDGGLVSTAGIVTGVKSNGFFIQAPDGLVDTDPATSEGLFVFTSSAPRRPRWWGTRCG